MNHDFLYGVLFGMLVMLLVIRFKKLQEDVKGIQEGLAFSQEAIHQINTNIHADLDEVKTWLKKQKHNPLAG